MDRDWNYFRPCSVMVDIYDVHEYDCECVLPTHLIGPTFLVTGACARGECVRQILKYFCGKPCMMRCWQRTETLSDFVYH